MISYIPHIDEARSYLIKALADHGAPRSQYRHDERPYGADIWIPHIVMKFYQENYQFNVRDTEEEAYYLPFYDAAWELARIGVLRPAEVAPRGAAMNSGFHGDTYTLTAFGISWVTAAKENLPIPSDPSRLVTMLASFKDRYGHAFTQRGSEAVHCHRTNNFLACCVMAGAAAESILLAVAIAKINDEAKVLTKYCAAGGRAAIISLVISNVSKGIADSFKTTMNILSYWRDEAGHGQVSTISEVEAFSAMTQLLRLAQFTDDNWLKFITAANKE